jgi:hypothetical protein
MAHQVKNAFWVYFAGATMFIVFVLNLYVGLVDQNLFVQNIVITPHYYFNWMITGIDIIASALLFFTRSKNRLLILSGVIWPVAYIGTIGVDIGTRLCLGAPTTTCFPTVGSAASYLLFGTSSFLTATFWPYTFILIIILLMLTLSSTVLFLLNQGMEPRSLTRQRVQVRTETIQKSEAQPSQQRSPVTSKIVNDRKYRFAVGLVSGGVLGAILVAISSISIVPPWAGGVIQSGVTYGGFALILFGYFYKKDGARTFWADFSLGLGVGMILVWFVVTGAEDATAVGSND